MPNAKLYRYAERKNLRSRSGRFEPLRRCDYRLLDEGDPVPPRRSLLLPASLATVYKGNLFIPYIYIFPARLICHGFRGFDGLLTRTNQHLMVVRVYDRFTAGRRLPRLPHEVRAIPLRPPRHGGRRAVVLSTSVRIKNNKLTIIFPQRYTSIFFVIFVSAD